ncbi:MAG: phosphoglycerate dehydrogenase, partial [Planctomycetes bacterium]|nr:phosphoglycerate dehydrogenase [Planctomycetota bacterium]
MKVLVTEKLSDRGLAILTAASGLTVDVKTGLSPEALQEAIGAYDGLVVRSATKVTKAVIERA